MTIKWGKQGSTGDYVSYLFIFNALNIIKIRKNMRQAR